MSPQGPKTDSDEKIENNFNGIVMSVLAVLAVVLVIAIFVIFKHGSSDAPANSQGHPAVSAPASK